MLRKIYLLVHDDPQIVYRDNLIQHSSIQHIRKLYRVACSREFNRFAFIDVEEPPIGQFVQIRLNLYAVQKTLDGETQLVANTVLLHAVADTLL
jgi:hypothetical protein